jgi:XTP/dITP diphosphohydrolase
MPPLIVATSNPGKLKEMQDYLLDQPNWQLRLKPPELEIEETGQTFMENARLKASQVAQALGAWSIADDSGLAVNALNGAPGLYSARYGTSDADRIARLLSELGSATDRSAKFICAVALARPNGTIALEAEGVCQGEILQAPQGDQGFGYDPIFYVPEHQLTFAEMSPELKHTISHRGVAFQELLPKLRSLSPQSASE